MSTTSITLASGEAFDAYVVRPKTSAKAPVVIVIQEIFGVNEGIRGKCQWLADQGFIAVAPDLFWRMERGVQLSDKTQEEWDKAFDLMNRFDIELGLKDLQAVIDQFRRDEGVNGKVGCLGYCLGGKIAYLMSCKSDVNAGVGYYAVGLEEILHEAIGIQHPLALHVAGKDKFSSPEKQAKVEEGLGGNPHVTLYVYPEQDHAFTRVAGDHYDEAAAGLADARTIEFFKNNLQ